MRRTNIVVFAALIFVATVFMVACGGDGFKTSVLPTTNPPITITVSPATKSVITGGTAQFTATLANTTNSAVTWSVTGGDANGTISTSGLYTAPSVMPSSPTVTITATSVADTTKSATATVTITPPTISVAPTTATVPINATKQFTATVTNATNTSVHWSISGSGCSNGACGTISASGLYTGPATVPSPATATVTATSVADPSKSASATVMITPPAEVMVTVSPTSANVQVNTTKQFTATVDNASNTAVTWSVSGAGCTGAACGTIDAGLYTAPASVPTPAIVVVTATSAQDNTKSAVATVTITPAPAVSVTVSPKTATVSLKGTRQFTSSVANASDTTVTWSLASNGCTGAACGTISSTGLYTAPDTMPVATSASPITMNVSYHTLDITVTARSNADSTITDTATITLTDQPANNNSALSGKYAFYFSGYNSSNAEVARVGVFQADGNGGISGGLQDVVTGGSTIQSYPITQQGSSYSIDANNNGTLVLNSNGTAVTYRFVLKANGKGALVGFDSNGSGAGKFAAQAQEAYNALDGNYVTAVTGSALTYTSNPAPRAAAVFRFTVSGTAVSNAIGELAVSGFPYGTGDMAPGSTVDDTTQRGAYGRSVLKLVSMGGLGTFTTPVYMYSADEGFAISALDSKPAVAAGQFSKQSGTLSLDAKVAFQVAGYDLDPGNRSHTVAGYATPGSNNSLQVMMDTNEPSAPSSVSTPLTLNGSYTLDANTGRGTITLTDPGSGQSVKGLVFILTGPNKGYMIEGIEGQPAKDATIGTIEPQIVSPTLSGAYFMHSTTPMLPNSPIFIGLVNLCGENSEVCSPALGMNGNFVLDDTGAQYDITGSYTAAPNGRGTMQVTVDGATHTLAYYAASPTKVYLVALDAGDDHNTVIVLEKVQATN